MWKGNHIITVVSNQSVPTFNHLVILFLLDLSLYVTQ